MKNKIVWQRVGDKLPCNDVPVLITTQNDANKQVSIGFRFGNSWAWQDGTIINSKLVTHWSKLPEPAED